MRKPECSCFDRHSHYGPICSSMWKSDVKDVHSIEKSSICFGLMIKYLKPTLRSTDVLMQLLYTSLTQISSLSVFNLLLFFFFLIHLYGILAMYFLPQSALWICDWQVQSKMDVSLLFLSYNLKSWILFFTAACTMKAQRELFNSALWQIQTDLFTHKCTKLNLSLFYHY